MMTTRTVHRDFLIDLVPDAQGWRVTAITHAFNGSSLPPPAFYYSDRATAERYAQGLIDVQVSTRRRR